jgi:hypothetical protein
MDSLVLVFWIDFYDLVLFSIVSFLILNYAPDFVCDKLIVH